MGLRGGSRKKHGTRGTAKEAACTQKSATLCFLLMWTAYSVFIELATILLLHFYLLQDAWALVPNLGTSLQHPRTHHHWIGVSNPGMSLPHPTPTTTGLEGRVLTTGPPGKPLRLAV